MKLEPLTPDQTALVFSPPVGRLFAFGPAGSGKTSAAVARLLHLVEEAGVPADQILVLVPQRTLAQPYYELLRHPDFPAGGSPNLVTLGGLAQRMIALFWPLIAAPAGFAQPNQPPTFLTLESAQFYLARLVQPLLDQGYFETVHLDRSRLLSQVLDNLNKSAAVGFDHTQISERLKSAWIGKPEQMHVYDETQECANQFRAYCLQNNLLDFSLQLEIFVRHLWPSFLCREYLTGTYRHLIFDNVEEDVPVVHDIIGQWLPRFESALLLYDTQAGYRSFLGADPETGWQLQSYCDEVIPFTQSLVTSPALENLHQNFSAALRPQPELTPSPTLRSVIQITRQPYYPTLLDWVVTQIGELVHQHHIPPSEIAVLSPFLSDSLRFSLMDRLENAGISAYSRRPSRSLREEPATHCLLTLATLAHPDWKLPSTLYDVRTALMQSIQGLDLIRADILTRIVFHPNHSQEGLSSFEKIQAPMQERITYQMGQPYQLLRQWLLDYRAGPPVELDIFLGRLFGEVLSQPGFGFHQNFESAAIAARLIESVQKFRWAVAEQLEREQRSVGLEYLQMVSQGVIANQYLPVQAEQDRNAVFIAPAYTFLMENRPVNYQFWLDIGSLGWWERLSQPLTHPVVLSRRWPAGRLWTDADEYATNQDALDRLVSGLVRRCRQGIFLCSSGLNEQGDEPRGPLLQAIQVLLRRNPDLEVSRAQNT